MARITELNLRDVRCFDGKQSARLGRVTLLVGENSTGKSTFLSCYQTFSTLANMDDLSDKNHFDEKPFYMGPFDTIARSGKLEFAISGSFEGHCHTRAMFSFARGDQGTPLEQRIELGFDGPESTGNYLNISRPSTASRDLRFEGPNFRFDLDRSEISYISISTWLSRYARHGILPFGGEPADFRKRKGSEISSDEIAEFAKFISFFWSEMPLPSHPSFIVKAPDPALPPRKRFYASTPAYLENKEINALVTEAGRKLGLWEEIVVKEGPEDQGVEVLVETVRGIHNLTDVGYGIHSLLPLLRETCLPDPQKIFLLQQPEIHVHPVAQAQLAQYLAESKHDFIIETHSDHLVDRFRICVMEGVLRPDELSIIYFEPSDDRTKSQMYSMGVDEQGNLLDVPDGYRSFFLRETERLMGFKD